MLAFEYIIKAVPSLSFCLSFLGLIKLHTPYFTEKVEEGAKQSRIGIWVKLLLAGLTQQSALTNLMIPMAMAMVIARISHKHYQTNA